MTRPRWPRDDSPRRQGQRRVRLYFIGRGKPFRILSVRSTEEEALVFMGGWLCPTDARIRRATALVRFVDPA